MVDKCIYAEKGTPCPSCNYPLRKSCNKFVLLYIDEVTRSIKAIVTPEMIEKAKPIDRREIYMMDDLKKAKAVLISTLLNHLVSVKHLTHNVAVSYGLESLEINEEFIFIDASSTGPDNVKALAVIESYAELLSEQGKFVLIYTKSLSTFKSFIKC